MSSIPYDLIATSRPFRFLVGTDKKEFFMHADLVASLSKPLSALVNGKWKESKEGSAELPEVDQQTFVRFCEFAYTGDYKAPGLPLPLRSEDHTSGPPEPPVESDPANEFDSWGTPKKKIKKKNLNSLFDVEPTSPPAILTGKDLMWRTFIADTIYTSKPIRTSSIDPSASCSEALMSHARLYVFADCYAIHSLMDLSAQELHRALKGFNLRDGTSLNGERVVDVVQLIDFLYRNTRSEDRLRGMLATYMACNIEDLWPNTYFQDVLESGEIAKAAIGQLLRRLN